MRSYFATAQWYAFVSQETYHVRLYFYYYKLSHHSLGLNFQGLQSWYTVGNTNKMFL